MLAHRQLLAPDPVTLVEARLLHDAQPRQLQVMQAHLGQALHDLLGNEHAHPLEIALDTRHAVETGGGELHLFVFEQPTHQLGARIRLFRILAWRPRQQHARLDLEQHRRHQQIFGSQLEVGRPHRLDVFEVLRRERRHRNVEHVEIGLADQVQQQIQRSLESFEDHLQRVGRNIQVFGEFEQGLAVDAREHIQRHGRVDRRQVQRHVHRVPCPSVPAVAGLNRSRGPWPRARHAWFPAPSCAHARSRRR